MTMRGLWRSRRENRWLGAGIVLVGTLFGVMGGYEAYWSRAKEWPTVAGTVIDSTPRLK